MKKLFFILISLLFYILISYSAGPPPICTSTGNDNCIDAINLTVNAPCVRGCTEGATIEGGEAFGCASGNKTIWFKFNATAINHQINIWQISSNGCYNGSVVWDGSSGCLPTIPISCHDVVNGPLDQAHLLTGLIIGNTYFIQVTYTSGGPCGSNVDVCTEVITYNPCNVCGNTCYAACEFISNPIVSDVTCCCPSTAYNPPMHGRNRKECYTFTANSAITTFSAIVSSNCGGGQFTSLNWSLYNSACTLIEGPTDIFVDNDAITIKGFTYTFCFDMLFANCNITELWSYVVVGGTLPIELLYFEGKLIENNIILEWITVSEINNDYFTVEKSNNVIDFEILTNIMGAGNSTQLLNYSYIDNKAYNGINYYRLKQTDYDGQYSYSEIIAITIKKDIQKYIYYDMYGRIMLGKWDDFPTGIYICFDGIEYEKLFKF